MKASSLQQAEASRGWRWSRWSSSQRNCSRKPKVWGIQGVRGQRTGKAEGPQEPMASPCLGCSEEPRPALLSPFLPSSQPPSLPSFSSSLDSFFPPFCFSSPASLSFLPTDLLKKEDHAWFGEHARQVSQSAHLPLAKLFAQQPGYSCSSCCLGALLTLNQCCQHVTPCSNSMGSP